MSHKKNNFDNNLSHDKTVNSITNVYNCHSQCITNISH